LPAASDGGRRQRRLNRPSLLFLPYFLLVLFADSLSVQFDAGLLDMISSPVPRPPESV